MFSEQIFLHKHKPNISHSYSKIKSEIEKKFISYFKSKSVYIILGHPVFSKEFYAATEASFVISWNIARSRHPYSDYEFMKKNITEVVSVLDPNNKKLQQ